MNVASGIDSLPGFLSSSCLKAVLGVATYVLKQTITFPAFNLLLMFL